MYMYSQAFDYKINKIFVKHDLKGVLEYIGVKISIPQTVTDIFNCLLINIT
jgi:hypothetical protein